MATKGYEAPDNVPPPKSPFIKKKSLKPPARRPNELKSLPSSRQRKVQDQSQAKHDDDGKMFPTRKGAWPNLDPSVPQDLSQEHRERGQKRVGGPIEGGTPASSKKKHQSKSKEEDDDDDKEEEEESAPVVTPSKLTSQQQPQFIDCTLSDSDDDLEEKDLQAQQQQHQQQHQQHPSAPPLVRRIGQYPVDEEGFLRATVKGQKLQQAVNPMVDSTELWRRGDFQALIKRLQRDGYLLIKGLLPRDKVLLAGNKTRAYLETSEGSSNKTSNKALDNIFVPMSTHNLLADQAVPEAEEWEIKIRQDTDIQGVLQSSNLCNLLEELAPGETKSKTHKARLLPALCWLRGKRRGQYTRVHTDRGFLRNNTDLYHGKEIRASQRCCGCKRTDREHQMLICDECDHGWHMNCLKPALKRKPAAHQQYFCPSCEERPQLGSVWIPLQEVSLEEGGLCMLPRSHTLMTDKGKESALDKELPASFFTHADQLDWHVGAYQPGDVMIFDVDVAHAAATNESDRMRLSLDCRWAHLPNRTTRLMTKLKGWATPTHGIARIDGQQRRHTRSSSSGGRSMAKQ